MGLGIRGRVVGALIFVALGATLAGCSTTDSDAVSATSGASIGQQAIGFTSVGSSAGSSAGWSSSDSCPDGLKQGFLVGAAGTTVTEVDPSSLSGVMSDPNLTSGDVASCAFQVSASRTADVLVFINMAETYQSAILSTLQSDGFVAEPVTTNSTGTLQTFDKGTARVLIQKVSHDGINAFSVIG